MKFNFSLNTFVDYVWKGAILYYLYMIAWNVNDYVSMMFILIKSIEIH